MATIIAIANQKGGVAKSTSTHNLAFGLADRGKRVLAIDNDQQGSLTTLFGRDPDELEQQGATLYYSLVKDRPLADITIPGNPALVPASIRLANAETDLITDALLGGISALRARITPDIHEQYDYILIDCPPSLSMLSLNALVAADYVLIPVATSYLAANGLLDLLATIKQVRSRQNPRLKIAGVLPTAFHTTHNHDKETLQTLHALMADNDIRVFEPVAASTEFPKISGTGEPAIRLKPTLPGSVSYQKLSEELSAYD